VLFVVRARMMHVAMLIAVFARFKFFRTTMGHAVRASLRVRVALAGMARAPAGFTVLAARFFTAFVRMVAGAFVLSHRSSPLFHIMDAPPRARTVNVSAQTGFRLPVINCPRRGRKLN
jgi:hypothetical protein